MSGYSKWATTKHKKAAIDARRGKLSARLIKNIEVATRTGGGGPAGGPALFDAIQKAKRDSVPADNITRAVKRGSGAETSSASYRTIMYEGHSPGDVTFYVECFTNSRNCAAPDVRLAFTRLGGSMTDPGSMAFLFSRCGIVEAVAAKGADEDSVTEAALEAGAEEIKDLGDGFVIESDSSDVVEIRKALQAADIDYNSAGVQFVAATKVELDLEGAVEVQRLVDTLKDSDDVQNIYHNMTVSDEVRAQLEEEE